MTHFGLFKVDGGGVMIASASRGVIFYPPVIGGWEQRCELRFDGDDVVGVSHLHRPAGQLVGRRAVVGGALDTRRCLGLVGCRW